MQDERLSKIISHALRHKPEDYNLILSKDGWVSIDELIEGIRSKGVEYEKLGKDDILKLVFTASKKRHEIKNGQIRALHGHSLKMEFDNQPLNPPPSLFHATSLSYLERIMIEGLSKMKRDYVHLSVTEQGAVEVAKKKYKNITLLQIDALRASKDGVFFYSNNTDLVWLCKHVLPQYISIIK